MKHYIAVCARGLEPLLEQELKDLGVTKINVVQAGVKFSADFKLAMRICLWSRVASRVVLILSEFKLDTDLDLYLAAFAISWPEHFSNTTKIAVDFKGTNNAIRNSLYGALKVKDAIVDKFEKSNLDRPNIDKDEPDVKIHVRLFRNQALLGIDLVGIGLHMRGYRTQSGLAPLRENLAAALVLRSSWKPGTPLLDPMCGAGTLLIEAAMMAADIAPGLKREIWPFEHLSFFNHEDWLEIISEAKVRARKGVKRYQSKFWGFDNDERVLNLARENAKRAGVIALFELEARDASQLVNPEGFEQGVIICNPPYGERLGVTPTLIALYGNLGYALKQAFPNSIAAIYSGSDELLSCIGMRADKQYKINNGALECVLKRYYISGSKNQKKDLENKKDTPVVEIAPDFSNRLRKNLKKYDKWAKKEGVAAYRVYDADLPEYNAAIDRYADYIVIQEYAAPKTVPAATAKKRMLDIIRATSQVTGIDTNNLVVKVREKQKGSNQYNKLSESKSMLTIEEYNAKFFINLYDYLDTGLFLDHRITRRKLGSMAKGKDFLNLFAYTGTATVHAALGGAKSTTTVDMSKTYLNWAEKNMHLNSCNGRQHQFIQADCLQWLEIQQVHGERYDLIFVDPPTFSNSKRMENTFDVQRDYIKLLVNLKALLRCNGTIVFSNNKRNFKLDTQALKDYQMSATNISQETLPLDFARNKHIHNCWIITKD